LLCVVSGSVRIPWKPASTIHHHAFSRGEIGAACHYNQHVEAGEQGCGIDPPVVIDEPFIDAPRR
jgi:hypothetical protein